MAIVHPALSAFTAQFGESCSFAQALVCRSGAGYELRHLADRERAPEQLRTVAVGDLRALAQTTAAGAFRPLKSAPNLIAGWRVTVRDVEELGLALNHLYPGAVADWYAARQPKPPVTHFREFTARQTGMYRITATLSEGDAALVARACCAPEFCLKRRLWMAGETGADDPATKSLIPCLEPCAILLEFARRIVRIQQEERLVTSASRSELETISAALQAGLGETAPAPREADFGAAANPRRMAWLQGKMKLLVEEAKKVDPGSAGIPGGEV